MGAGTGPLVDNEVFRIIVEFQDSEQQGVIKPATPGIHTAFFNALQTALNTVANPGSWHPTGSLNGGEILLRAPISLAEVNPLNCRIDAALKQVRTFPGYAAIVVQNVGPAPSATSRDQGVAYGPLHNECPEGFV